MIRSNVPLIAAVFLLFGVVWLTAYVIASAPGGVS